MNPGIKERPAAGQANISSRTIALATIGVMSAVTCIIAPFSVPIGPVPVSLTTFVLFLSVYLLGWKKATLSVIIYLLIGMAGLPVFSGFSGGLQKLAGPTGGYLIGYIPMAIVAGLIIDKTHSRFLHLFGMILGTLVLYTLGTAWFCVSMGSTVARALSLCVLPFIPGDIIKIVFAMILGMPLKKRLENIA